MANWAIIPSLMLGGLFLARVGQGILMAAVSNEVFGDVAGGIAVFAIDDVKATWKALATGRQNP